MREKKKSSNNTIKQTQIYRERWRKGSKRKRERVGEREGKRDS